jgi:hypothetical protein
MNRLTDRQLDALIAGLCAVAVAWAVAPWVV